MKFFRYLFILLAAGAVAALAYHFHDSRGLAAWAGVLLGMGVMYLPRGWNAARRMRQRQALFSGRPMDELSVAVLKLRLKTKIAWWLPPYLRALHVWASVTHRAPSKKYVARIVLRSIRPQAND